MKFYILTKMTLNLRWAAGPEEFLQIVNKMVFENFDYKTRILIIHDPYEGQFLADPVS